MEPTLNNTSHKPMGPVIGSVIVVLMIVLGGLYFWGERLNKEDANTSNAAATDTALESLNTQGTSDSISSLETDAAATDLSGVDTDVNALDSSLNAQ